MKKLLGGFMVSTLLVSSLAGCSGEAKAGTDANAASNIEKTDTQKADTTNTKKVIVTIIQNKVEIQEQLEKAITEFNASQDTVEVQPLGLAGDNLTTVLQTQFGSAPEKAPTIFTCADATEMDKFLPYMAELDDMKAAKVISEGQDLPAIRDGKLYGLPVALEGFGLIYNKDLFKKANVNPDKIKSIDDLVKAAEKLEAIEGVEKAIAFSEESYFRFMHLFNWPFATMEDPTTTIQKINAGKINLKDIPELAQFAKDLDKIKPHTNLSKATYDEQVAGFATGQFAMIHQGNWAQTIINDYGVDFDYGFLPLPVNGNDKLSIGNNNFFRVNKYASEDQQTGAKAFLDWLITDPIGQRYVTEDFKFIPAYEGFDTGTMDPLSQEIARYAEEGKSLPWIFGQFPAGAHQEFAFQMEKYYAGQIDSTGLLDELQKVWVQATKE